MPTKYVFVTGGVVSSLGKGLAAASIGCLLEARGFRVTLQKMDPYINVDAGTMSPYQHGEVFVTDDGGETDLDLGHYERFTRAQMTRDHNVTTGKVYHAVISRERRGDYLGRTVQVIPHITDEIKASIRRVSQDVDVQIVEVGGTVGDIEGLPFLEAIRQLKKDVGRENVIYIHLTLVPFIKASGELKTKATQHSVKELRAIGIQPDIVVCRTDRFLPQSIKSKIALFCDVDEEAVITAKDVETIYEVPLVFHQEGLDDIIVKLLGLPAGPIDLSAWESMVRRIKEPARTARIAVVGKYVELRDSYKSLAEALTHGGIAQDARVETRWVDAEQLVQDGPAAHLADVDGILIPGGFGDRGIPGKVEATQYAREHARAVPGHLPGTPVRGDRVRAARGGAERRQLGGVRRGDAASGDRHPAGAADDRGQGRHHAPGPLSHRARRRLAGGEDLRPHAHPGAPPAPLRGLQRVPEASREERVPRLGRVAGEAARGDRGAARPSLVRGGTVPPGVPVPPLGAAPPLRRLRWSGSAPRSPVRPIARLLAAIGLVASAGTAAHARLRNAPPSVFEERATSPAAGATSDPALRQRFLSEFKSAPPEKRRTVLEAWVPRLGVAGLLDALETGFPSCHDHAHELGKAAYAVTHDMPAVLQACQTRCVSGCMHGVLMEAFTERPGSLRDRIATLCDGEAFRQIHKKGDCIHGVGHGAAYVSDYDIPRALTLCESVGERAYQYYCASGAYMQLFMTYQRQISARDDQYPCDEARRFAAACYRYKVFFMLSRAAGRGEGIEAVIKQCLGLPSRVQPACFHGIGHASVGPVAQTPARIHDVCERGPAPAQWLCIQGVVEKLAEFDEATAQRVCGELQGKNAEVCREAARNKLYGTRKVGIEHYFVGR